MLMHFTRASSRASALDNLIAILKGGVIRGSRRMVRGRRDVVCLFDVPVDETRKLLESRNRRRYEPFGIAIDKRYAFQSGARPVIYLPWREAAAILSPDEHWRIVSIDLQSARSVDWTFEREWRVPGGLTLDPRRCVALVDQWRDAEEIYDRFDGHPPCAGVLPVRPLAGVRA
jgi:hypothetical protein